MKRILVLLLGLFVLVIMTACTETDKTDEKIDEMPQLLLVDLKVAEQAEVDGKVEMSVIVTQGEEKIEDANEVVFEVWEEGKKEESITIESENKKDGLYTAETTFKHDGIFHIQSHVTARNMHSMPSKQVTVGTGGNYDEEQAVEEGSHNDHEAGHEHKHARAEGFLMQFKTPEIVVVGDEMDVVVHLQQDNKQFENAKVRYEIWYAANPDMHDWVNAEEITAGEYVASYVFGDQGTVHVQIHVEDDHGLHEHEEHIFEVTN